MNLYTIEAVQRFAQRRRRAGGSDLWRAVAFATFLLRIYRRRARPTVLSEALRPGESILITHTTQRRG